VLTVATWNLENLYRPGGEFRPKTDADYHAKLGLLAALNSVNADVISVQEVGQPDALADSPTSQALKVAALSHCTNRGPRAIGEDASASHKLLFHNSRWRLRDDRCSGQELEAISYGYSRLLRPR
jgi:hypothetical protein